MNTERNTLGFGCIGRVNMWVITVERESKSEIEIGYNGT